MENGIDTATATTSEDQQQVTRSAGIVSIAVMASRLLGLVREKVIAYYFAAGVGGDAFYAAFRIPNLMRDLFGEGALSNSICYNVYSNRIGGRRRSGLASGEPGFQREFPPTNADNAYRNFRCPRYRRSDIHRQGISGCGTRFVGTFRFRFQA